MILNQPFPAYSFSWRTVRLALYAGLCVFLILYLLRPFRVDNTGDKSFLLNAFFYGCGTFALILLNSVLLPLLFPSVFAEERWTTGKEIGMMLWHLVTIAIFNLLLTHFLYKGVPLSTQSLLHFLWITLAVGIFPLTLILLLKQQVLLKKYAAGAQVLDQQLAKEVRAKEEITKPDLISFTGDNQNEKLAVPVNDLRFIASADNYIKVHYIKKEGFAFQVLRSSLKKAEAAVQNHPQFFRCHRTYIANLAAVEGVSGNAQGYKLHLKGIAEPIPVSRTLNKELEEHLKKYKPLFR